MNLMLLDFGWLMLFGLEGLLVIGPGGMLGNEVAGLNNNILLSEVRTDGRVS